VRIKAKDLLLNWCKKCVERAQEHGVREILAITGVVDLFDKLGFKTFNQEEYALFKMLK
jgi:N-acetylglutamate synthase-like GNAT family acetyltransferase